jgi:uncharacterized membrane protein
VEKNRRDADGIAASINDNGQVVGATGSCAPFDPNSGLNLVEQHAMLWQDGAAIDLGNLGAMDCLAGTTPARSTILGRWRGIPI